MVENVFVVGLNDHSAAILSRLPDADRYRFHKLLDSDVLLFSDTIPLPDLLAEAQQQVEAFDGPVHAIIGFWDFPVSTMVPMLCERLGLRWASLESVVKCEHKYWSRLEQRRVIDEYPRFGLVDLDAAPTLPEGLRYPVWVKPIKSVSSALAYRVADDEQLQQALTTIRGGIATDGRAVRLRAVPAPAPARGERRRRARVPGRGGGDRGAGHGRGLQLPGRRARLRHGRLDHL